MKQKELKMARAEQPETTPAIKLLRPKAVVRALGLSRATLHRLMRSDPSFPSPVRLGSNSIGFVEGELLAWIEANRIRQENN